MNEKIQTLINNLREAGALPSARMIEIMLEVSEEKAIEHIQEIVEDYSGVRAELCAAFLAEINQPVAETVIEAPVQKTVTKEQSYEEYVAFMSRQDQPYMNRQQWQTRYERTAQDAPRTMKHILKLDLTINGKEYWMGDAVATATGFKSLTAHDWIIYDIDEKALWNEGCVSPDLNEAGNRELFAEIAGIDADEIEEAHLVMCLWEENEETGEQNHIESCYTLTKLAELI